ncbi:MAG: DUF4919 domain-containing protein [Bacteroidota bacterium]
MKKISILFIIFCSFNLVKAQEIMTKPNYKKIEKEISDKKSVYYYSRLFDRFMKSDSTLTSIDNHYLYYGYSFNEKYNPYKRSEKSKDLNEILSNKDKSKIDFDQALKVSEEMIDLNPFDLRVYNAMLYILENKNDKIYFNKIMFRMNCIIDAIMKSGDGKTIENAIYVIEVPHEYDVIDIIGLEYGGEQSLVKNGIDFLKLKDNKFDLKGLYFDVSPSFNFLEKSFK